MALSWSGRRKTLYSGVGLVILLVVLVVVYQTFFTTIPTCFDGAQNGGETGIDCGGSCALICQNQVHAPLVLWARAFNVGGNYYTAAAYVQNNNSGAGARQARYSFQLFDDKNSLIIERDGVANIPPVQTVPIIEPNINVGNRVVSRTLFAFTDNPVWQKIPSASVPVLRATQQNLSPDASKLTAIITNNSINSAKGVTIEAVLFDQDGIARAASKSVLDVSAKGSEQVIFTWPGGVPNIVKADITVLPSF